MIFLCETGPIRWIFSHHSGCWWLNVLFSTSASVATVGCTQPCVSSCLWVKIMNANYRKISNIRRGKSRNLKDSRLGLQLSAQCIEAKCVVENEDVVGAAPTGDASTTSEWSTIEYGPVTMIVPASGHQVRCIPWVQMGTFNKEIGLRDVD